MTQDKEPIIRVRGISKRLKDIQAVDHLSLDVLSGDVYGFLGPNGSGKSTTIRMLLSLVRADEGKIEIFGLHLKQHYKKILGRIGALVEEPDFYEYLSAYKNLELLEGKKVVLELEEAISGDADGECFAIKSTKFHSDRLRIVHVPDAGSKWMDAFAPCIASMDGLPIISGSSGESENDLSAGCFPVAPIRTSDSFTQVGYTLKSTAPRV